MHKFRYIEFNRGFSDVLVSSMDSDITYEGLIAEMKDICRFDEHQPFTMKWVDEEGGSVYYSHFFEHCDTCRSIHETRLAILNNNFLFPEFPVYPKKNHPHLQSNTCPVIPCSQIH